ncbi:MAG: DUF1460 domain-containing protein [Planctomycetes bacterium]|nr:DUF1460 domain-containing protein [Planctomycetota bacterium]
MSRFSERPLYTLTEADVDQYLAPLREVQPELTARVAALGRQNIGQPYDIYLLGEFPYESHDPDPIYCLQRSDCLTFCEHMYALALGDDWWSFLRILQRLRYRDGIIGMLTRNHYTLADWNRNNAFLFEDLTPTLGAGKAAVPLQQTCQRARFFAQFGIGQDIPDEALTDTYIPKDRLPDVLDELRNADFVNIIRGDDESQWCGHTGLIARGGDGTVDFLHSARPAVREEPLLEYVQKDRRCLGVKILRLRPGAEQTVQDVLAASSPGATEVSEAALNQALQERWDAAPDAAKPVDLDWCAASRLQAYRLDYDTPLDPELQQTLEECLARICAELDMQPEDCAAGVLDLTRLRLAMVRPDAMFYAASVPKICILAAWFEQHPEAVADLPAEVALELGRMIKHSDNALAAKYGQLVTLEQLEAFVRSKRYRFYDEQRGGGLWIGKHYTQDSPRIGDPLHDHSHGATVRQCLRYYLLLEQGRLISAAACTRMREVFASPQLEHIDSKFVSGLKGRNLKLIRKSGTWEEWHLDTARIAHGDHVYLLVGMAHHPRGAEFLSALASEIDDIVSCARE